jgi:long-chain fatty acid transport protein
MTMKQFRRTVVALAVGGALAGLAAGEASAAGFALIEQSGSGMGNAFAGGAASAEDASTIFYNPAGMSRLPGMQGVVAVHAIDINTNFNNGASQSALGQPLGSNGGNAGDVAAVPNLYFSFPVNRQIAVGLGINAPFGLKTEYSSDWIGRYQAIKSEVKTVNINPSLAFKVNEQLSLGIGASYQRIDAELTKAVNYTAVVAQGLQQLAAAGQIPAAAIPGLIAANAGLEGSVRIKGDDSQWGYNVGALYNITPQTRMGVAYRSAIKYTVSGDASFNSPTATNSTGALIVAGANATTLANGAVTLDLKVPDSASVSIFHQLNQQWDLMGDISWTGWSSIPQLQIVRSSGTVLSTTPENWKDTWRYSVGANYHMNDQWKFRGGLAFDQTPVPDSTRTPRLPDQDRTWVALGAQYRMSPAAVVDMGYAHLFVKDANINQNDGNQNLNGLINGTYNSKIDIFSVQLTYNF